jgi:hypothetical protein
MQGWLLDSTFLNLKMILKKLHPVAKNSIKSHTMTDLASYSLCIPFMTIFSAFVSIHSVYKIIASIKNLQSETIRVNNFLMILHIVLLSLMAVSTLLLAFVYLLFIPTTGI